MKTFKDFLRADLDTFINLDEFAELAEVNGKTVKAVIIKSSAPSASSYTVKKQIDPSKHLQLSGNFITLYVKTADLEKLPKNGDFIYIDSTRYKVQSAAESFGVYKITCATDLDRPASLPRSPFFDN